MSKEIRIGLLVTVAVVVFFAGFQYLRGKGIFSTEQVFYTHFESVQGLQSSSLITIRGMMVGRVRAIELADDGGIRVAMAVKDKYPLPRGTVATLYSVDLMGAKGIRLELGQSTETLQSGAILPAAVEPGKMDALTEELKPILRNVQRITLHLDTLLTGVNTVFSEDTRLRLAHAVASLDATMQNFSAVSGTLKSKSAALGRTIDNAEQTTAMLAANRSNIDSTLTNLNHLSSRLKDAPVAQTVQQLQDVAGNINSLLRQIENGDGSLGKLVQDKALYDNLSQSAAEFSRLAEDLRKHPGRYINVNIFGRRAQTVLP